MLKKASIALAFTLLPISSFAGGWASGYGETPRQAIQAARDGAVQAIAQRGEGCLSAYNGKDVIFVGKEGGLYHFKAHYSYHGGSCGQLFSIEKAVQKHIQGLL